jgi:hypothetical protein
LKETFPEYKPLHYWSQFFILTFKQITKVFNQVYSLIKEIIIQLISIYGTLLRVSTRVCKKIGFIGELLLIPIAFCWIASPLLIPIISKKYSLLHLFLLILLLRFIPTLGIVSVLVFKGTRFEDFFVF